ncbi:MAG: HAMP domain-containing protein [Thermoplasmata archaeon]|nr:MAG: HAMP domain-containing protein [Thermoplasmata archaeon]
MTQKSRIKMKIRTKILIVFLVFSLISLIFFGYFSLDNLEESGDYTIDRCTELGDSAVDDSTTALESQAEDNLVRLAKGQAAFGNMLFEKIESEVSIVSEFAATLIDNSSSFQYKYSYSQNEQPEDIFEDSVYVLAPGVSADNVRAELDLSSVLDNIFIPTYSNDPYVEWIYIGTGSGFARIYPWDTGIDPTYDPRVRDWYTNAVESGGISWTSPYLDVGTNELMITCSAPVYSTSTDYFWVVAADITIKTINSDIIKPQVGETGYGILVDNNGNIIARPGLQAEDKMWDESFELENLLESTNPDLKAIGEDMTTGNSGISRCELEEGEKYFAYAPIESTGWSVAFVMPIAEIIAPAVEIEGKITNATGNASDYIDEQLGEAFNISILFVIIALAVISVLSILVGRSITRPIFLLKDGADAMQKKQLEHKIEVNTGDEFEFLAESLNQMAYTAKFDLEKSKYKPPTVREQMGYRER